MGATNGKYPSYPCADSDLQLIFLDAKSDGIPLNQKNLDKAMQLSTKPDNAVTFYTEDHEKARRWRGSNLHGGSILDFVFNN